MALKKRLTTLLKMIIPNLKSFTQMATLLLFIQNLKQLGKQLESIIIKVYKLVNLWD